MLRSLFPRVALHRAPIPSLLSRRRALLSSAMAAPPLAKKLPRELVEHGDLRVDNYYWLRDDSRSDPQVLDYLRAENSYTAAVMSGE